MYSWNSRDGPIPHFVDMPISTPADKPMLLILILLDRAAYQQFFLLPIRILKNVQTCRYFQYRCWRWPIPIQRSKRVRSLVSGKKVRPSQKNFCFSSAHSAYLFLFPASRSEEGELLNSPSSVRPFTSNNSKLGLLTS